MPITITYPKTALRPKAVPISGELRISKIAVSDLLIAYAYVVIDGAPENTEYVGEPGTASEVGRRDFEFRYFQRWDVPSGVRINRYFTEWQHDTAYVASVIADFFNIEDASVAAVRALIEGRPF